MLSIRNNTITCIILSLQGSPDDPRNKSYKHPYVTDEMYERITSWVRNVNVSVDWASVVHSAFNDHVTSYEDTLK